MASVVSCSGPKKARNSTIYGPLQRSIAAVQPCDSADWLPRARQGLCDAEKNADVGNITTACSTPPQPVPRTEAGLRNNLFFQPDKPFLQLSVHRKSCGMDVGL